MSARLIGRKRMPRGIARHISAIRESGEDILGRRDVVQLDRHNSRDVFLPAWGDVCYLLPPHFQEPSILMFRSVGRHEDDWGKVRRKGGWLAPAFVHVVLHGACKLSFGRKSFRFSRGDVFAMDMNKPHEVASRSLCITAVVTVPRVDYL